MLEKYKCCLIKLRLINFFYKGKDFGYLSPIGKRDLGLRPIKMAPHYGKPKIICLLLGEVLNHLKLLST